MCKTCITCIEWIFEDWACRWDPAIAADCIKNGRAYYMELLGPQATYRLKQLRDRIGQLDAEIERLKAALKKYGTHKRGCKIKRDTPANRGMNPKGKEFIPHPCTCGLDDALEGGE